MLVKGKQTCHTKVSSKHSGYWCNSEPVVPGCGGDVLMIYDEDECDGVGDSCVRQKGNGA